MRAALFVVCATLLFAVPARADEAWNAYAAGIVASNKQAWAEAVSDFRRAIALNPTERAAGLGGEPYLPHYRLSLALEHMGDVRGARAELLESERQGVIGKTKYIAEFRERVNRVKMTAALPPPTQTIAFSSTHGLLPMPQPVPVATRTETEAITMTTATASPQPQTPTPQPTPPQPTPTPAPPTPGPPTPATVASPISLIDQLFANLSPGTTVFDPPPEMKVGRPARVIARMAAAGEDAHITENLPHNAATIVKQQHITPTMSLALAGDAFDIATASPTEQLIGGGSFTEWRWDVKPKSSGQRRLDLHIVAILRVDGEEKQKELSVITRKVLVHADPIGATGQFIVSYWEYLSSTIIIPLALFFYHGRRKAKKKRGISKDGGHHRSGPGSR